MKRLIIELDNYIEAICESVPHELAGSFEDKDGKKQYINVLNNSMFIEYFEERFYNYNMTLKDTEDIEAGIVEKFNKLWTIFQIENKENIDKLTYKSSNGTDFTVGLIPGVIFMGGGSNTVSGVYYNPNMPTEECFVSPNRHTAEGIVYSTKPLSVMGTLVDNFAFRFEGGKVVEVIAQDEKHKAILEQLTDASRNGVVEALEFANLNYKVGAQQQGYSV
mgnify:CR=1 FL=1